MSAFLFIYIVQGESDGYFKKTNDFAFLKTPALEENFLCVLTRKFGGRAIPPHSSAKRESDQWQRNKLAFSRKAVQESADKFERARIWCH